jgi:hypothetical protein
MIAVMIAVMIAAMTGAMIAVMIAVPPLPCQEMITASKIGI